MTTTSEPQLPERAARNQSRFREYNERIEPHNAVHHWVDPPYAEWICECAFESCTVPVLLTTAEYEAIREASPARFFVAPTDAHVVPEIELVVERQDRYWVVEKVGEAADVSERLDPRSRDAASEVEVESHADDAWNLPLPKRHR